MQKMYTIYDKVAEKHSPPFTAQNDQVAIRMFGIGFIGRDLPKHLLGDYALMSYGEWNDDYGTIQYTQPSVFVADGDVAYEVVERLEKETKDESGK